MLQSFRISTSSAEDGMGGFWGTAPSTQSAPVSSFLSSAPRGRREKAPSDPGENRSDGDPLPTATCAPRLIQWEMKQHRGDRTRAAA